MEVKILEIDPRYVVGSRLSIASKDSGDVVSILPARTATQIYFTCD